MSYRDLDTETLRRRIDALVEARDELDARLEVLTGVRRGRWVKWLPKLVFLVCLAVVTLMMAGIALLPTIGSDEVTETYRTAQTLRSGAWLYRADQPAESTALCPTVQDLNDGGYLPLGAPFRDGWGRRFRIECGPDPATVRVVSAGPDGVFGTADDIG
ncbi:MAG: hypothetical protein AB8I08_11005 [Sandaracinaceae bacterium]